jgi:hypothetical protein
MDQQRLHSIGFFLSFSFSFSFSGVTPDFFGKRLDWLHSTRFISVV